ncbi:hypothetical protein POTOM_011623 [Populus tomentosa]|uniref:Reverse transcriptase zinc-binding domain-containing protein n=1 Tax=Populus tomentosa TaxID=118781 RepID=A0A8X8D8H2_POPTO|nr:hypothetical protein POTOM_011623 [Populus tomentosa]
MEKLACMIAKEITEQKWKPIHAPKGEPVVSHLFIADDILFLAKARNSQVRLMGRVLSDFCKASGLKVNYEKSRVSLSGICFSHGKLWVGLLRHKYVNTELLQFPFLGLLESTACTIALPRTVACSWLTSHSRTVHSEHKWRWLWRLRVPEKIRNLFWLVFHGSLPTASLMGARNLASTAILCGDCAGARRIKVTSGICIAPNFWTTDIVERITVMADSDNGFLFLAALWWIWRQRNCFALGELYKGDVWLLRNIYCAAADFHLAWNRSSSVANVHVEFSWQ